MYDLVIRNGTVIDGTGSARRPNTDVAVLDGKIVAVGTAITGDASRVIDATGLLVTPGFVDIHTHYDGQITWDPQMTPSSLHGVTTLVMGNCGVGFAPARPDQHNWLIGLMEGVEDIPADVLAAGMSWEWETLPQYLDALEGMNRTVDFAVQIPHGSLRAYVMGERGARNELATEDDIQQMAALVQEAVRAGALGLSTSRTRVHRAADGEPVPGTFASHDEVMALAHAMKRGGFGVFELATQAASGDLHGEFKDDLELMGRVALETGLPVTYLLNQVDNAPEEWREILGYTTKLNQEHGTRILAQIASRPPGVIMGLLTSMHPFKMHLTFQKLDGLALPELVAELRKPEVKERILSEQTQYYADSWFHQRVAHALDSIYPLGAQPDYEPSQEDTIAARAKLAGRDPYEYCYDALLENDGNNMLYMALVDYTYGSLDGTYERLQDENCVVSLSDAGAHVRAICDASAATSLLTHFGRDRSRGPLLPLEFLVKRQTSETASVYGLNDRGIIASGYKADINVIDFDHMVLHAPYVEFDLPAGGGRLLQKADGYVATIVSGEVTLENGELTGTTPGRLIRGVQSAPA